MVELFYLLNGINFFDNFGCCFFEEKVNYDYYRLLG